MASSVLGAEQSAKVDQVNYLKRKNVTGEVGDERGKEVWRVNKGGRKGSDNFVLRSRKRGKGYHKNSMEKELEI